MAKISLYVKYFFVNERAQGGRRFFVPRRVVLSPAPGKHEGAGPVGLAQL
jgi:hypothetical protein